MRCRLQSSALISPNSVIGEHCELRLASGRIHMEQAMPTKSGKGALYPRNSVWHAVSSQMDLRGNNMNDDSRNGCRVFVVEDEALVSMLIQDLLIDSGCDIAGSASGFDEALRKV